MSLTKECIEAISSGRKVIESRLYDEKRRTIQIGDTIIFTENGIPDNSIRTDVVALLQSTSFEKLFTENNPALFGKATVDELLIEIRQFYTPEQEAKYGVLGIQVQLI